MLSESRASSTTSTSPSPIEGEAGRALEVVVCFDEAVVQVLHVPLSIPAVLTAGSAREATLTLPDALLPSPLFPLLRIDHGSAVVFVPAGVQVRDGDEDRAATEMRALPLRPGRAARTELRMGAVQITLSDVEAPPRPRLAPRLSLEDQWTTVAAGVVAATLLSLAYSAPPEPRTLVANELDVRDRLAHLLIVPTLAPPPPPVPSQGGTEESSAGGRPARDAIGRHGTRTAPVTSGASASVGPRPTNELKRREAYDAASRVGVVAILGEMRTSSVGAWWASEETLGGGARDALGSLEAGPAGDSWGDPRASGLVGDGPGGGGDRADSIGVGTCIGPRCTGRGPGRGPGDARGPRGPGLGDYVAGAPPSEPRMSVSTRSGLPRDVIRRIVRQHQNEVRYCYERRLMTRQGLDGRVVVAFTISPSGMVSESHIQASTLSDAETERCIVDKVRTWTFPSPENHALTQVTYPFVLRQAGTD